MFGGLGSNTENSLPSDDTPDAAKKKGVEDGGVDSTGINVRMFSNARDVSIQGSTFNTAGRDITVIHNYNTSHDPEPAPWKFLSQWSNLFSSARSHMFHAAEILKNVLPNGFLSSSEINLEEKIVESKYPRLNAPIVLTKTSLCIPGFISQTLSSVRYSFSEIGQQREWPKNL
ncbi:hypothetical protein GALMADRAFT_259246 [Galerina marginata CBS 339.88]|uniref:Uncharacterized protein n=1 Tax=Galerina marginata (strain CBS 339.88) TaxID=685588 RepID=A0A067S6J7_GALM3|nr:hypothetical protein GALMADRAFT_259246 [Galerina marginata CBS 339.88]